MIHTVILQSAQVVEIVKEHLSAKYDVKSMSFYVFKADHPRETDYFSVTATVEEEEEVSKTKFTELCDEIQNGPFSILSEAAKARLILMIEQAMADGYKRGRADEAKTQKRKKS